MNRKGEGNRNSKNKQRVLQGYRREGKRFIPPILQLSLKQTDWMNDRVPELIWIALLIHVYGVQDGISLATKVASAASKCSPTNKRAFAATSDFAILSDEEKDCVRFMLRSEGTLDKVRWGLAELIANYPEFSLAFLGASVKQRQDNSGTILQDLKAVIYNIRDREGTDGVIAQTGVVCIFFHNNMLEVPPNSSLANLGAIAGYPSTEESKRVAASVRALVNQLLTVDIPPDWRNSFWNQGRILAPCELD